MVYRKKYSRRGYRSRRSYGSKMPWWKKRYSAMQLASKAYSTAKYIKGLVNVEKKICNTGASTAASTTPTVISLHDIAQGDTVVSRSGNSVKATSLALNITLTNNASATEGTLVRYVIVKDNQQISDTEPAWANVFESADVRSFLNIESVGRFTILHDKVYHLDDGDNNKRQIKLFYKMQHHIRYNGAASTDIQKGGIYAMYLSDQGTNTATCYTNARLRYVDN